MNTTPIARLMTTRVERVERGTPLSEVTERMRCRRISCVVVCEGERPVGILSERDLVAALAGASGGSLSEVRAEEVMSSPAVTIPADTPIPEALEIMQRERFRRLPVVDHDGRVVGIVTQTDVLRAHSRELEVLHARLEENVANRTRELMGVVERLEALSLQDALLEIGNRRAMEMTLDRLHETALRYERPYALVLFDVDLFKAFNDRYGHAAGDRVLQRIATRLREGLRRSDSLFRYGGEEILAVMPETGVDAAEETGQRLCLAVEGLGITHECAPAGVVTVSGGVSAWESGGGGREVANWRDVLELADRALYRAKDAGRNRIAVQRISAFSPGEPGRR